MLKVFIPAVAVLGIVLLVHAADKPKVEVPTAKVMMALPPHPLDGAFATATDTKSAVKGLEENAQFKKAIEAALKAKKDTEDDYKNNPGKVGPGPNQAARKKFLEVINNEK